MKLLLSLCCSIIFVIQVNEGKPVDNSTLSSSEEEEEKDVSTTHATELDDNRQTDSMAYKVDNVVEDGNVTVVNRTAHARMSSLEEMFRRRTMSTTTTTTLLPVTEYDYWWYFTTPRRPRFSYRDFPGKPGVATWKEISPAVAKETKKNSKSAEPTAEGVQAGATLTSGISSAVTLSTMLLILWHNCFRKTF